MYGGRANELIKTLDRQDSLPPYEEEIMRQIYTEMNFLNEHNQRDVQELTANENFPLAGLNIRHAALERNKQCVLAYTFNRLLRIQDSRWTHGTVIQPAMRMNMTDQEIQFFNGYNKILANYMRSIGQGMGLELSARANPPKHVMSQVKVLEDYEFEDAGKSFNLIRESIMFLPTSLVGGLVRDGVVQFVE